jgi:peroxiredoxin
MQASTTQMIKDWGLALALTVGVLAVWGWMTAGPTGGGEAPDFALPDVNSGAEVALADHAGEVVVVNFWATWCGPCRSEIPEFTAFHEAHPEVPVLGISVDERLDAKALSAAARKLGISYTVLHDAAGSVSDDYGVAGLPTTFVIDGEGTIVNVRQGAVNRRSLEKMVGI